MRLLNDRIKSNVVLVAVIDAVQLPDIIGGHVVTDMR